MPPPSFGCAFVKPPSQLPNHKIALRNQILYHLLQIKNLFVLGLQQIVFQKAQADPMVRQTLLDVQKQGVVLDANLEMLATAAVKLKTNFEDKIFGERSEMQDEI